MIPISPVLPNQPGAKSYEIVFAKDQPEYLPLPAIKTTDGQVITRWKLSLKERIIILFTGNLFLRQLTFNNQLQPQSPSLKEPQLIIG